MKKMFVAAIAISTLFMVSCNSTGSGGGDPKTVLSSFFDAMQEGLAKKDFTAARKLATAESKSTFDMMEAAMKMAGDKMPDMSKEQYDKSRMEIGEAKIEGDKATVPVKELKSGESIDFTLKKESGNWKVDMGALIQTGLNKLTEHGMDGKLDSMKNEIQKMNPDSLKEMMNKGIKMLDSLKQKSN